VRVRLPMCSLDAPLIEVLEKHAIREVNLGLCTTRDMQRLSLHAGLTALINSPAQESPFTAWIPPEEGRRKLEFLGEKLLPKMNIPANSFDAEDIEHISAMKGLTYLDLYNCPALSDALAPQLGKLTNLTTLYAMGTPLTAAGMKTLAPLAQLRCLSVMNCNKLNDDGMDVLTAQFKGLEELILGNNGLASDRLFDLLFRLTKLRTLIVGHQPKTTIAGLKKLAGLRSLERLSVVGDNYSEELLLHLLEKLPNLQVLSFHSMAKETLSPKVLAKAEALNKKIYLFQVPSLQSRADAAATAAALLGAAKSRIDLKQGHFG